MPVVIELLNGFRFVAYPDCYVSSGLLYTRIPDYNEITFLRKHVDGGTLVDVGANVGSISLLLADKIDHAFMFEPNPIAAARARDNITINSLRFEVHEAALSDSVGEVELEDRGGVDSSNRTIVGKIKTSFPTRTVPRITLDSFLETKAAKFPAIKAVKIDVEGHENSVLRGMLGCLKTARPRLVMFEYLQRTSIVETLAIFESVDYCVFRLLRNRPLLVDKSVEPLQNLFACPKELLSSLGIETRNSERAFSLLESEGLRERTPGPGGAADRG